MTPTPAKEEYLQAIYTLRDERGSPISARLAEYLSVSPAAVSEMVHRLEREELVSLDHHKEVHLTNLGLEAASSIVRRHRLAERMLTDLLGFEWWESHEEAERLEHAMSPELEARLVRVLGDPDTCPHGNPMPGRAARAARPLGSVPPGSEATIERIPDEFEHEPGFLEYLAKEGLRPGRTVRLVAAPAHGPLQVEIDGVLRELRRDCAEKVFVRA